MILLRPPGRGNWKPILVAIEGARAAPLLVRVGDLIPLAGQLFRVAKVMP